jgi:hypothetical protein
MVAGIFTWILGFIFHLDLWICGWCRRYPRRTAASNLIAGATSANLPANIGLDNVSIRMLTF